MLHKRKLAEAKPRTQQNKPRWNVLLEDLRFLASVGLAHFIVWRAVRRRYKENSARRLTYDANGNLINDDVNTYTWDARNRLVSISGNINASFQYDAFGRRVSKSVDGTAISFLYDGSDVVQEQVGGT